MMIMGNYNKEQLIYWLQDFARELGRTPTLLEIDSDPSMPCKSIYQKYFKSYSEVCRKANLEPNNGGPYERYTDQELLKHLRKLADKLGRTPRSKELHQPSRSTYHKRFGSYSEACRQAGLEPRKVKVDKTSKELLKGLKEYSEKVGRTPTQKDLSNCDRLPSVGTFQRRFGSWKKAIKKAGLKPRVKGQRLNY